MHAEYPLTGPAAVSPPSPTGRVQPYDTIPRFQYRRYGRFVTRVEETTLTPERAGKSHMLDYATRDWLRSPKNLSVQTSVLLFSTFGDRKVGDPKLQDLGPATWF